jgi:hypothetical protein
MLGEIMAYPNLSHCVRYPGFLRFLPVIICVKVSKKVLFCGLLDHVGAAQGVKPIIKSASQAAQKHELL